MSLWAELPVPPGLLEQRDERTEVEDGSLHIEGDREGETEEHFCPILRGVVARSRGWAAHDA